MPVLRSTIRDLLPQGYPTLTAVAAAVGVSRRTLQRRIGDLNSSHSSLVDNVRLELARQLLDDRHAKIAQIADRTGFANPSGFSRAFRRWTGFSPRSYRVALLGTHATRINGVKRQEMNEHPE